MPEKSKPSAPNSHAAETKDWVSIMAASNPWLGNGSAPLFTSPGALIGVDMMKASLQSARAVLDASRAVLRLQQDLVINLLRQQMSGRPAATRADTGQAVPEGYLWPMNAAMNAYQDMTISLLKAERDAVSYVAAANKTR